MPGPPPKPAAQRRRRNAAPPETMLPAAGRSGPPPAWPLGNGRTGELELWADLWATPQAVAWSQHGWTRVIARYCRVVVASETPDASPALMSEARQLEDRLGLTPMAMRRLMWRVDDRDEIAERRDTASASARSKARVRAVDPSAVART